MKCVVFCRDIASTRPIYFSPKAWTWSTLNPNPNTLQFTLPTLEIHPTEKELWSTVGNPTSGDTYSNGNPTDLAALCDGLQGLRSEIGDSKLSARTQKLLMINDRAEAQVIF